MEKPLFLPLRGEFFDAFATGDKGTEFRPFGPRWNADTCRVGRAVTLSRGYGKSRRLSGIVAGFREVDASADPAIRRVYPLGDSFAAIEIALEPIAVRERLPERRQTITDTIEAYGREFTVSAGINPANGRIREVFLGGEKSGSTLEHIFQDAAVIVSLALQHGITAEAMARSIAREPAEIIRPEDIDRADLPCSPATLIGATLDWIISTEGGTGHA